MRRIVRSLGPILLLGLAGAGGPQGKVVRIDQAPRREVYIPSGTFVMGIDPDDAELLEQACVDAFQQREQRPVPTASGANTTFCEMYRHELEAMVDEIQTAEGKTAPRRVYLSAFAIDRDEVTVAEYRACIVAGECSLDPLIAGDERYIADPWPLVNVTWGEAQTFCRWRGGRLPTEAEWERAARGDDGRRWPWGGSERNGDFNHGEERSIAMREMDRVAWAEIPLQFLGDPDGTDGTVLLARPGSYPWGEGPYGTRDQAGNVAEWTADVFGGISANFNVNEHTLGYRELPSINPRRDGGLTEPRVVRGGSWRQPAFLSRTNVRDPFNMLYEPDNRYSHIGFRCARDVPP